MKKHIFITGSTDGFGKLAAISLASQGHALYVHGRNAQKVSALVDEIETLTGNSNVKGFVADFSDLKAVAAMVELIEKEVEKLDVLINNAGVLISKNSLNADGIEERFVVNYLAPYLLTNRLLPILERGKDVRIINLSSAAQADISYDAMLGKASINMHGAYAQSKLAITMWSSYLANQHKAFTVIAVNPGSLLNTKMAQEAYGQHWSPAEKGSDLLVDLAIGEEHSDKSGMYFDNDQGFYSKAHPNVYNDAAIEQLIEFTNKLV